MTKSYTLPYVPSYVEYTSLNKVIVQLIIKLVNKCHS